MFTNHINNKKITKWLNNFNINSKKVLLVYGKSGLGKYTCICDILRDMDYDIHTFYLIDFLNKKDLKKKFIFSHFLVVTRHFLDD